MALMHKVAKSCPSARDILNSVELEEAKLADSMQGRTNQSYSPQPDSRYVPSQCGSYVNGTIGSHAFQVHRRNLWIKLALIEDKLVDIVEYLAKNWKNYYDPRALMADYLYAQILCSLLVGPSALEYSRSKTNDCQCEDPTAHELLRRHKLANPIACLCKQDDLFQYPVSSLERDKPNEQVEPDSTLSQSCGSSTTQDHEPRLKCSGSFRTRRRPLSIKTQAQRATLVTNCHHYSCQEISEHQHTRGYSLRSTTCGPPSAPVSGTQASGCVSNQANRSYNSGSSNQASSSSDSWSLWSPRMLHEILHQNSKLCLLYAKNNILLESPTHRLTPGYLSLHQTSSDLILKWIPNQMINGSHTTKTVQQSTAEDKSIENYCKPCSLVGGDAMNSSCEPMPVESSYLDLVVSISVSRIVLLHCRFRQSSLETSTYDGYQAAESATDNRPPSETRSKSPLRDTSEETLILVEADGVQRAPFRFPKGGLRLFLSCLQNGLSPDRYLDPAINFDECGWPQQPFDSQESGRQSSCTDTDDPSGSDGRETPVIGLVRLDSFLKRLPSLKRLTKSEKESDPQVVAQTNNLRADSTSDPQEQNMAATNNYVYRIVAVQQPDWPLLTPPDTALGVTSSTSCLNGSTTKQRRESLKFRWNLRRWTGFHKTSLSGGSTSSQQTFNETFDQTTTTTTDDVSTTSMDQHDPARFCPQADDENSRELARVEAKLYDLKKSTSDDVLETFRTQSIQTLCESMRRQILARAFYGWLAYCRRTKVIRQHLKHLINPDDCLVEPLEQADQYQDLSGGLTYSKWSELMKEASADNVSDSEKQEELIKKMHQLVYYGGIESDDLRRKVWPYLLGYYKLGETESDREAKDEQARLAYVSCGSDWSKVEKIVKQRDSEILAANMAKVRRREANETSSEKTQSKDVDCNEMQETGESSLESTSQTMSEVKIGETEDNIPKTDSGNEKSSDKDVQIAKSKSGKRGKSGRRRRWRLESTGSVGSDASITDQFGNNIHRIDKDVQRCDRNLWYFKERNNLDKLRNIMCSYVWQHLDVGYVQGMCDLAAPFLVIFDEEILAFNCFSELMKRMVANFPHGSAMDKHFEALKYLMQVLDPRLFEVLQNNGDYTYFYFCYRWLLLDFKRGE